MRVTESKEQHRLRELVEEAKRLNTYPGIEWNAFSWDITKYEKPLAHQKERSVLYFTVRRKKRAEPCIPYEQPYADFAKAMVRMRASQRGVSFSSQYHMLMAHRYLYAALQRTGKTDPTALTRKHFHTAVVDAQEGVNHWTLYAIGNHLQEVATWLNEHGVVPTRIRFRNPVKYPGRGDGLDSDSQAKGLKKMPSAQALEALADISNHPSDDDERILLRIIDLLVVGGFRIGEVLRLPLDCWVETPALDQNGREAFHPDTGQKILRYGLRYCPEKSADPYVKWIPDVAVPVAKRAVDDLTRLCANARAAALALEQNPDRVPLPGGLPSDDRVDLRQLTAMLGVKAPHNAKMLLRALGVRPVAKRRSQSGKLKFLYRVGEIEKALLKRRGALEIIRKPGGQVQMLSQSLCVMFKNQFTPNKATLRFLPELIGFTQINAALGNDKIQSSIYTRRGLTEVDGSSMRIKTHAFRHWLNTLMARGGLSDVELARWSGRRDASQNEAYKHGMVAQRVAWAHEMIKAGMLKGPMAEAYHAINDPVEKQAFLETFVNVAHFTPYGVCTHDFAIDPCRYHLNCLGGCAEYLRTKGDPEERKNIQGVLEFHLVQIEIAKKGEQEGIRGAGNYIAHSQRIVEGATAALAVDDKDGPGGQLVKVFPNSKAMGKPMYE